MADYKPYGDDETTRATMVQTHISAQSRRKGPTTKEWLVVSESGQSHFEVVDKHAIMRRTGLPARDLRVLDPVLSYPSTILGRERAVVVNLEHIKAVITAKEVLMINSLNPLFVDFVKDLQHKISSVDQAMTNKDPDIKGNPGAALNSPTSHSYSTRDNSDDTSVEHTEFLHVNPTVTVPNELLDTCTNVFPFEFRALEACLESSCRCLEIETQALEKEAYPALDELTSDISTLNLERVRQIKSRLVTLSGRVQKLRDELEHLLDDDNDMSEMYLTEKLNDQSAEGRVLGENESYPSDSDEDRDNEESKSGKDSFFSGSKPNVEQLEMLLEAYFAQVDGILQKLSTLSEYVGDTEDYINIMLDDKQNQLLQMGVILSTAIMILNAGIVVVGLFGMNINISLYEGEKDAQFWETALGVTGACIVLYLIAFGWGRKRSLFAL